MRHCHGHVLLRPLGHDQEHLRGRVMELSPSARCTDMKDKVVVSQPKILLGTKMVALLAAFFFLIIFNEFSLSAFFHLIVSVEKGQEQFL